MKTIQIIIVILLSLFITFNEVAAQEVSGSVSFMSSGTSPVPAFGIDNPAFFSEVNIDYEKWIVSADMAFNDVGHIWFTDIWLRHKLTNNIRVGVDWTMFGQDYTDELNNEVLREITRYVAFEIYGQKSIGNSTAYAMHWYVNGFDERTIKGHFSMAGVNIPVEIGSLDLTLSPSIFQVSFTGENDGLFVMGVASVSHKSVPLSLSLKVIPPIESNIPEIKTQKSLAITYSF